MLRKIGLSLLLLVFLFTGIAISASPHRITHLGNPRTRFYYPPLKTVADLQKMLKVRKADIQTILEMRHWTGNIDDLVAAVESGKVTETSIEPGAEIPFMANRPHGKPGTVDGIIWKGARPFSAFVVTFDSNGSTYHFYFPKPCANFWMEQRAIGETTQPGTTPSVSVVAEDVCLTQPAQVRISTSNASPDATMQFTIDGQTESMPASTTSKQLPAYSQPGPHTITIAMQGASPATATFNVKPCPPVCSISVAPAEIKRKKPFTVDLSASQMASGVTGSLKSANVQVMLDGAAVNTFDLTAPNLKRDDVKVKKAGMYTVKATVIDDAGQKSENACEASFEVPKAANPFFLAGFVGKERLVQDDFPGGRCAPLIGFKAGALPEIAEDLELELSIGGKINTRDGENSSIFADVAINKIVGRGFFGGGVSFWDLTESDTRTVALLLQFGFDLNQAGTVQFVGEARGPFDQFDDLDNNYQIWGGVRIRPWR